MPHAGHESAALLQDMDCRLDQIDTVGKSNSE